ncbi:MAG: hypothetical protein AAF481_14010 [Acidobacteriota bacterium]
MEKDVNTQERPRTGEGEGRKPYSSPRLIHYGSLHELTRGGGNEGPIDAIFAGSSVGT